MSPAQGAIQTLVKRIYEPPSWLGEFESIDFSVLLSPMNDSIEIRAHHITQDGLVHWAIEEIDSHAIRYGLREKGALVDMVREKVDLLVEMLEPPMPANDLLDLMMQAFGDEQACDVLVDAGLEREAIKPLRCRIGTRADTRTDAEKAADERADLHKKAKAWARPFVEILFRRNWSTKPWAVDLSWLREPSADAYEVRFNPEPWTMRTLRDRVRQLTDLRDAEIINDEEVSRFLNEEMSRLG